MQLDLRATAHILRFRKGTSPLVELRGTVLNHLNHLRPVCLKHLVIAMYNYKKKTCFPANFIHSISTLLSLEPRFLSAQWPRITVHEFPRVYHTIRSPRIP